MKFFKKSMTAFLVVVISATLVACGPKKDPTTEDNKQKIEYITELNTDNVENVVIEYKEILSYYNDLKNNLKILNDVSKNPDLERDAINAKDSIGNGKILLTNTKTTYKPLVDAKEILIKMYDLSLSMSDNVIKDVEQYQKDLSEYDTIFKEFKDMMDKIREDIKAIRGTAPVDEKENQEEQKPENTNTTDVSTQNNEDKNNADKNTNNDKKPETNKNDAAQNNTSNNNNNNNNSNTDNSNDGFVPSVSSLNKNIRSEIKNAGFNAGEAYKQSGASAANLDQVATQQFNDIEGDNPIQKNQLAEARAIFVNAFKKAYYSTK